MNSRPLKALWHHSSSSCFHKRFSPRSSSSLSRFFSSTAVPSSADPSFFTKYKKYLLISSPALLAVLFHASLFNYSPFRYFIEHNLLPGYVDYLRQQYGYEDEDPVERARITSINQQIAQSLFFPFPLLSSSPTIPRGHNPPHLSRWHSLSVRRCEWRPQSVRLPQRNLFRGRS
jgi:hypothetical protein